ncbi:MAG: hypothetical protein M0R30_08940 [Methanoregula sp.]|uniref:hypothetical protein n=1 Tax=Methanoregula sp. TaxID=2052170 RepID=UPI0025E853DE|nr:hypothetical protein [Methanoregula sp.]MCK9631758.1 hypothetical protein [Methanoregula sp.]
MIQLIGNKSIIVGIANGLRKQKCEFHVYGNNCPIDFDKDIFTEVNSANELKKALLSDCKSGFRLSAAAPWIFDDAFLQAFEPYGIFNIHGTSLPQDRGGTIVSWQIMNRKRLGFAIIHKMHKNPDAGSILQVQEFIYSSSCRTPLDFIQEYEKQQIDIGINACIGYSKGNLDLKNLSKQPEYLSTYWPRLKSSLNGWIDWSWNGYHLESFILAFDVPYDGAYSTWRGKTIKIKSVFFQPDLLFAPYQWGLVYRINRGEKLRYLAVAINGGTLYIQSICDQNGIDLINLVAVGDRFLTQPQQLSEAAKRTVKYNDGLVVQEEL